MANVPYKINPVKAACARCDKSGCGIHEYNDVCYTVCGGYSGSSDPYTVDYECANQCQKMIEEKRHQFYDAGYCDHQQPYRPVIWNESPAYFVKMLQNGMAPKEALEKSRRLCEKYKSNIASECIERQVDLYNAIESYIPMKSPKIPMHTKLPSQQENKEEDIDNNTKHILIASFAILIAMVIIYFFYNRAKI